MHPVRICRPGGEWELAAFVQDLKKIPYGMVVACDHAMLRAARLDEDDLFDLKWSWHEDAADPKGHTLFVQTFPGARLATVYVVEDD